MNPYGRKVTVLGLGKSGFESAAFLKRRGYQVFASEITDSPEMQSRSHQLEAMGIETEIGGHTTERILQSDWALISPGIPPSSPVYHAVQGKGIPILSEIEVAGWFCPTQNVIAVTGTAGKTTVTTLIARVIERSGGRAVACGNIGNPWVGEIAGLSPGNFVVLEVSSFQLRHCRSFRPRIAVLLNLSVNHQDWHKDLEEYVQSKLNIFRCQTQEDFAVYRSRDKEIYFPHFEFKAREVCFDLRPLVNPNEEAVRAVAKILGIGQSEVEEVLKSFEGVDHRLEKVAEWQGVFFVNDSKCTTTASLTWALEKFPDHSVILIAGGHPKSDDFHLARELVRRKVKKAVLIGEAAPLLARSWEGAAEMTVAGGFRDSIEQAVRFAQAGDTVLLSPACASFDMFKNYVERGNLFKQLVKEITAIRTTCDLF